MHSPQTWPEFMSRVDNIGLPIMEAKSKYNRELLQLEEQIAMQIQVQQSAQNASVGGSRTLITNSNIYQIVDEWFENKTQTEAYYGKIGDWDVSRVTDMSDLFEPSTGFGVGKSVVDGFNEDISAWDVSNVVYFDSFFNNQTTFNQPLDSWDVSNGENFLYMFSDASSFNQSLNSWNITNATRISLMFHNATAFNGNISDWDVSNVFDFSNMFDGATSFNQDLSSWDIGNSANDPDLPGFGLSSMFKGASSFNQNISGWVIPNNILTTYKMFENATSFDQNLSSWNIASLVSGTGGATDMFKGITLSTANYSALLIGWAAQTNTNGVTLNGGNSQYSAGAAADARALMQGQSWVITDGGQA